MGHQDLCRGEGKKNKGGEGLLIKEPFLKDTVTLLSGTHVSLELLTSQAASVQVHPFPQTVVES